MGKRLLLRHGRDRSPLRQSRLVLPWETLQNDTGDLSFQSVDSQRTMRRPPLYMLMTLAIPALNTCSNQPVWTASHASFGHHEPNGKPPNQLESKPSCTSNSRTCSGAAGAQATKVVTSWLPQQRLVTRAAALPQQPWQAAADHSQRSKHGGSACREN